VRFLQCCPVLRGWCGCLLFLCVRQLRLIDGNERLCIVLSGYVLAVSINLLQHLFQWDVPEFTRLVQLHSLHRRAVLAAGS
jgi:hypothetical protein